MLVRLGTLQLEIWPTYQIFSVILSSDVTFDEVVCSYGAVVSCSGHMVNIGSFVKLATAKHIARLCGYRKNQ